MPYGLLFRRAFDLIRRDPSLLVMGFIFALLGGSGGSTFNFPNGGGDSSGDFPGSGDPTFASNVDPALIFTIVAVVACLIIVLVILFAFLQAVAQAGLVEGIDQVDEGMDVKWRDLWRKGWSGAGRRLFGLRILLTLLTVVPLLIAFVLGFLFAIPFVLGTVGTGEPGVLSGISVFGFFALLIPLLLIFTAVFWVLNLVVQFAIREIVLDSTGIIEALKEGWGLFRQNVVPTVLTSIALIVLGFLWIIPMGIVIFGVVMVSVLLGAAIFVAAGGFGLWMIPLIILAILLLWVVASAISAPLLTYNETVWTLLWRHLRGDRPLVAEQSLVPA